MAAGRKTERDRAYLIWRRSGGAKKLSDIARQLNVAPATVRAWKRKDEWDARAAGKSVAARRPGGQPGNRNAAGPHDVDQAGNQRALRHGAYARLMAERMTEDEREAYGEAEYCADPLEALRLEVSQINVQQLRLMTRLQAARDELEELSERLREPPEDADAAKALCTMQAARAQELDTLEAALDRASGRKTRILQLLAEAGREQTPPTLVEFAFGAPGVPRHEEAGDED